MQDNYDFSIGERGKYAGKVDTSDVVIAQEQDRIVYPKGCPVCEFPTPMEDYDICPSCGFEACGQEDWPNGKNWPLLRQQWIDGGRVWWSIFEHKPINWPPASL